MKTLRVHIAEIATSNEPGALDGIAAEVVSNRTAAAGHTVVERSVVANDVADIRAQLVEWSADPSVDAVIAIAADANVVLTALAPLGTPQAFASPVHVADLHFVQCKTTAVFVVPGATSAVMEAMDNIVAEMSRLAVSPTSASGPQTGAKHPTDQGSAESKAAAVPAVGVAEVAAASRRRTQPPPPPADKRASTPPPVPAREDVVSTSEIVAIAEAPPPAPARENVVSTSEIVAIAEAPPPVPAREDVVSTSEIVAIAEAPPTSGVLPSSSRASTDEPVVAGAMLLAPRRRPLRLGRWIAVALLAGASGFAFTAWILRDHSSPSRIATTSEAPESASAVGARQEHPGEAEQDAGIPEVIVEVSGSPDVPKPSKDSSADSSSAQREQPDVDSRATDARCPEETCVLDRSAHPCCARYQGAAGSEKPTALARWMVKAGVETVKPRVVACGEKIAASGTVKVTVKVDPDGSVVEAVVAESPNAELGECVGAALRSGKFAKTTTGGTFRYPFVF